MPRRRNVPRGPSQEPRIARQTPYPPEDARRRVGRSLLMTFYAVAGVAHLVATDAMVRIVPGWIPAPRIVVIATGLCELLGAVALASPRWRRSAGVALAAYAICVLPANIIHAIHDLRDGTGLPIWYHAPRLLLQPAIVWWALWASGAMRPR